MNIRKLVVIGAALVMAPAAFAQTTGGSAGDGDRPITFTKTSFAELDKDKNGILDKKEILASTLSAVLVKKMDTNMDGSISEAEFNAYQEMTKGNAVPKK